MSNTLYRHDGFTRIKGQQNSVLTNLHGFRIQILEKSGMLDDCPGKIISIKIKKSAISMYYYPSVTY